MSSLAERRAALMRAIRSKGGEWTTGRVRKCRGHAAPYRSTARGDLEALAKRGQLKRHEKNGRRYYTLPGGES